MSLRPPKAAWQNLRDIVRWCEAQDTMSRIIKSTDEPKTSDDTLAYDSELSLIIKANRTYIFRGRVWFDTANTPEFQFQFNGPGSPTTVRFMGEFQAPGSDTWVGTNDLALAQTNTVNGTGSTGGIVKFDGLLVNGANGGQFGFQWAQQVSDASATTVRAGSYIEYLQI